MIVPELRAEIERLLEQLYQSLATSAELAGIPFPATANVIFYTDSQLARYLHQLAEDPTKPAPGLRHLATFLHQCPPTPTPLPLPDWFWHQVPLLANRLIETGQWLTYPQASQEVSASYQQIQDLARKGVLLSLYAAKTNAKERYCRYVWKPDLLAYFTGHPRSDPAEISYLLARKPV